MSRTVTVNNPKYNYTSGASGCSAIVPVSSYSFKEEFGTVSSASFVIDWDIVTKYALETDSTNNPLHVNSTIEIADGGTVWFRGFIDAKPEQVVASIADGVRRTMNVSVMGKEGVLLKTVCPDASGNTTWTLSTSTVLVGATSPYLPMKPCSIYGSFVNDTLWPDPLDATGAKLYLKDALCASDTINAEIDAGDTAPFYIEFTSTDQGFPPQGWVRIENEMFYCEGYDAMGGGSPARYRTQCIARAQLGTTAATHAASTTAYAKTLKMLGPQAAILYRDDAGGTNWTALRQGEDFVPHPSYGCFVLTKDASTATFAGTYYAYDEDSELGGATIIHVEDVVRAFLTAPRAYGGAGLTGADCNLDETGIAITRYDYDPEKRPINTWNAIHDFIQLLNLTDELRFWFDHKTNKFRLALVGNTTPSVLFACAMQEDKELSITSLFSGYRIFYTNDQDPNLIQPQYSHHVDYGSTGALPEVWRWTTAGGASWQAGSSTTLESPAAQDGTFGQDAVCDGKLESKLTAEINHDPGGAFTFGDYWFGPGAPTISLSLIEAWINAYRSNTGRGRHNENETYVVHIEGCADYDPVTYTGSFVDLGKHIEGVAARDGKSVKLELETFIIKEVNAIRLVWDYMAGPIDTGHKYIAALHELRVQGNITRCVLIQTTDDAGLKTNPLYLYAENAHVKLRGGVGSSGDAGCPRIQDVRIGAASEAGAITIGRAYLKNSLKLHEQCSYKYAGAMGYRPAIGETAGTDTDGDGSSEYTGVMLSFELSCSAETGYIASYRVLDYDAEDVA